jgi:hypothetical protein
MQPAGGRIMHIFARILILGSAALAAPVSAEVQPSAGPAAEAKSPPASSFVPADFNPPILVETPDFKVVPLGFHRRGRSRTWVADHGWWLTVVEFQPSAWSKGSYLNVAAHWLWSEIGTLSFDFGGRIAEHVEYLTDEQFTSAVVRLAENAANEAQRLTAIFGDLSTASKVLLEEAQAKRAQPHLHAGWSDYHAGVAAALIGQSDEAKQILTRIVASPAPPGSILRPAAERMVKLLSDPTKLLEKVTFLIAKQREELRLLPLMTPIL